MAHERTRENRLRRQLTRYGYSLVKSRSRDPRNIDYGLYGIRMRMPRRRDPNHKLANDINDMVNPALAGHYECSWTLDDVEDWMGIEGEQDTQAESASGWWSSPPPKHR